VFQVATEQIFVFFIIIIIFPSRRKYAKQFHCLYFYFVVLPARDVRITPTAVWLVFSRGERAKSNAIFLY
jgi:hypothetical protein